MFVMPSEKELEEGDISHVLSRLALDVESSDNPK